MFILIVTLSDIIQTVVYYGVCNELTRDKYWDQSHMCFAILKHNICVLQGRGDRLKLPVHVQCVTVAFFLILFYVMVFLSVSKGLHYDSGCYVFVLLNFYSQTCSSFCSGTCGAWNYTVSLRSSDPTSLCASFCSQHPAADYLCHFVIKMANVSWSGR